MARKLYLHKQPGFNKYLEDAYINRGLTMAEIAKEVGTSAATILNNLRRFNIPIRTTADCLRGKKRPEYISEAISKAHKGKVISEEQKQKLHEIRKNKFWRSRWCGGKRTGRTDEYIQIYKPDYPNCSKEGYVMEHRLVMEQKLGRYLTKMEIVHHINGVRDDNRPENLELMASNEEHMRYHMTERWRIKREQNMSCG